MTKTYLLTLSQQDIKEKMIIGDQKSITITLKCSADYVKKVLSNKRDCKSMLARKIWKQAESIVLAREIPVQQLEPG